MVHFFCGCWDSQNFTRWQSHWPHSSLGSLASFKCLKQTIQIEHQLCTRSFLFWLALNKALFPSTLEDSGSWSCTGESRIPTHTATKGCIQGGTGTCSSRPVILHKEQDQNFVPITSLPKSSWLPKCFLWTITYSVSSDSENNTVTADSKGKCQLVPRRCMFSHSSSELPAQKTCTIPGSVSSNWAQRETSWPPNSDFVLNSF